MPRGHVLSIYARFSDIKDNFTVYFSGKRRSLLHPNTAQRPFFSHYNLLLGKLKEKLARKARVNTERVYRIVLMPPEHPIILSKVKRSIVCYAPVSHCPDFLPVPSNRN